MLDFGTEGQRDKRRKKKENTCRNCSSSVGKALFRMEKKKQGRRALTWAKAEAAAPRMGLCAETPGIWWK